MEKPKEMPKKKPAGERQSLDKIADFINKLGEGAEAALEAVGLKKKAKAQTAKEKKERREKEMKIRKSAILDFVRQGTINKMETSYNHMTGKYGETQHQFVVDAQIEHGDIILIMPDDTYYLVKVLEVDGTKITLHHPRGAPNEGGSLHAIVQKEIDAAKKEVSKEEKKK
jgi:hypothetical protein